MYECSTYEIRPQICKDFPIHEMEKLKYPSCTYWFDTKERHGECSRCGECCEFSKVFTIECGPCLYLKEINNKAATL